MLLCCTLVLIESVLIWSKYIYYVPILNGWVSIFLSLIGPLALITLLMYRGTHITSQYYFIFLIPILLTLINAPFIFMNTIDKQELFRNIAQNGIPEPFVSRLKISFLTATLSNAGYALWMLTLRKARASKRKRISQLIAFINAFAFANIITLIINRLGMGRPLYDYLNVLIMAILIYTLGYLMNANALISDMPKRLTKRYKKSSLTDTATESILKRLHETMAENQLYLDPELRLSQLAEEIGTTTHLLSQAINETMQTSYSELITDYRLAHAKEMMSEDNTKKYLLKEISYKSGFNNKTSFSQAFKKSTGLTPSQIPKKSTTPNPAIQD